MKPDQALKLFVFSCFLVVNAMNGGYSDDRALSPSDVKIEYYLGNTSVAGSVTVDQLITSPDYSPSNPTFVVTHGWDTTIEESWVIGIKDAILSKVPTANVFLADWSSIGLNVRYPVAKNNTVYVGQQLASFIRNNKADPSKLHVIGHSLGSHVAGIAGYMYSVLTGQKIARITGLDPATPLYSNWRTPSTDKLDKSDAVFVDTIFTSMAFFRESIGLDYSVGHVNFFPNGGDSQPGCLDEISMDHTQFVTATGNEWRGCSHARAHELFVESVTQGNIIGYKCSYPTLLTGHCYTNISNVLGYPASLSNPGDFILTTRAISPYANDDFNVEVTVNSIDVPLGVAPGILALIVPQFRNIILTNKWTLISSGRSMKHLASVPANSLPKGGLVGLYWSTVSFFKSGALNVSITLSTPDAAKVLTVAKDVVLKKGVVTILTIA